jgi:biopolymer transport protein ExbD
MKQDQMLILGIVMLVIFMVMMPTHKQRGYKQEHELPHQMTKAELQKIETIYTAAIGHGCYTNQDVIAMHAAIEKARCHK